LIGEGDTGDRVDKKSEKSYLFYLFPPTVLYGRGYRRWGYLVKSKGIALAQ